MKTLYSLVSSMSKGEILLTVIILGYGLYMFAGMVGVGR